MANFRVKDITGEQFGQLTAMKRTERKHPKKGYFWECQCKCGNTKEVCLSNLKYGTTKSCGCLVGKRKRIKHVEKNEIKERGFNNYEFPPHLHNVDFKDLIDGHFRVFKNGEVYRCNERGKVTKPKVNYISRHKKYASVTCNIKGKQETFYVHRLIAEAFVANPENKNQVNHIDGNPRNNDIQNLEWVTSKENVQHAYSIGLIPTLENSDRVCIKCSQNPVISKNICQMCVKSERKLIKKLITNQKRRKTVKGIDIKSLKPKYKKVAISRYHGMSLEEIGTDMECTREYVRQLLRDISSGDNKIYLPVIFQKARNDDSDFKISLSAARVNAGMSIAEVSEAMDVTYSTIRKWEKGETKIPIDQTALLVKLYQVPDKHLKIKILGNWAMVTNQ